MDSLLLFQQLLQLLTLAFFPLTALFVLLLERFKQGEAHADQNNGKWQRSYNGSSLKAAQAAANQQHNSDGGLQNSQVSLTLALGFSLPSDVSMPSTKVAESADVMKKIIIRIVAINDTMVPKGNCSSMTKRAVVVSPLTASASWTPSKSSICMPVPRIPKTR